MMKRSIFIGCFLLFQLGLLAQRGWSYRECVKYAMDNNIVIKQQALAVEKSEIDLNTSRNERLPNLNAGTNQTFSFGRSPSYSTGLIGDFRVAGTNFSLSSSVPLFAGFKLTNQIKSNRLNLQAALEGLNKVKENLELQVASLYLEVLFKKEIGRTYEEQLQLSKDKLERTRVLVESGRLPDGQLLDMRAQYAKDELNYTTARTEVKTSLLNLAQALNIMDSDDFDILESDVEGELGQQFQIPTPDEVFGTAMDIKPQVKEAVYKLESSQAKKKVARSAYWPTLTLGLSYATGYDHIYGSMFRNRSFSDQIRNNQREGIGFSLNVPIFNRFQVRNTTRLARLNVEGSQLELDNVKLNLYKEIQQAYQSALAARSKFFSSLKALEAAKEAVKYAEERYDVGRSTVYELNESRVRWLVSKSELLQAKYEFLFRNKVLEFYRGTPIQM